MAADHNRLHMMYYFTRHGVERLTAAVCNALTSFLVPRMRLWILMHGDGICWERFHHWRDAFSTTRNGDACTKLGWNGSLWMGLGMNCGATTLTFGDLCTTEWARHSTWGTSLLSFDRFTICTAAMRTCTCNFRYNCIYNYSIGARSLRRQSLPWDSLLSGLRRVVRGLVHSRRLSP